MEGEANHGYTPDVMGLPNGIKVEKSAVFSMEEKDLLGARNGKVKNTQVESPNSLQGKSEVKVKKEKSPSVGPVTLYRYASCTDVLLMAVGIVLAVASGVAIPAVLVIFGKVIDEFIDFEVSEMTRANATAEMNDSTSATEVFLRNTAWLCMWNALLGVVVFSCNYVFVTCFSMAAANQAFRIRCRLMRAVLRQEMAWYDTHQTGDFATRITGDLSHIQDGIGEKVSMCIGFVSTTLFCVIIGIYNGWKLALVILCWTPLLTGAMAIVSKIQATVASQEMDAYGTAGAVAEEVLGSIRTVVAFGGQEKEIQRYEDCLIPASRKGIKRGLLTGIGAGITWFSIFAGYALAFWYGMRLVLEEMGKPDPEYTGGILIAVFMNVMLASIFIGQSAPYFEAFNLARGAAAKVFSLIDREPEIDSSSEAGIRPKAVEGNIMLKDVYFNYPARPEIPILNGLSMEVKPGETVALVGASGCGKSTIVQLLLRFYDAKSGSVQLDGSDIKTLNVGWLRDHIGLVGQEPVLFSTTIEENIRMGRNDATMEDVIQAAKTANAHSFIEALPKKYKTTVGEKGTQLSGGQKQRIAIARALVRNPRILLLDEATSALDTESESVVQAALDEARRGRTTVIVAHRLSTIRTADKIVVLEEGVVKETGSHEELMEARGIYYSLVVTQTRSSEEELDEEDEYIDVPYMERHSSVLSAVSEDGRVRPNMDRQISTFSRQISTTSAKDKEEEEEEVDTSTFSQTRLLKMSAGDWPYILIGGLSSIMAGLHFPAFGIIFGDILGVLKEPIAVMQEWTNFYCLILLGMAITAGISNFSQVFLFSVASQRLTFRLRKMVFANIISQDISFFDSPKNGVGSLCSRLNSDASSVQGATGSRISIALQSLSTLAICIFICLYYNWKIGLVNLAFLPLMLLGAAVEARVVRGHMQNEKKGIEQASKIAIEAIECIRTVASLHQEETFYKSYHDALLSPHKKSRLKSHIRGLAHAFGQGIGYFAYSSILYYGSRMISHGEVTYTDLIKILRGVMVGAAVMGQVVAFTPDYEKARSAAVRIFRLLELRPTIDAFSVQGKTKQSTEGTVEFSELQFSYPNRPQIKVLRGLDAVVRPGQTVALVGSSGCGKSTCVQLLERFYDPADGKVMVDSDDIKQLNVSNHRSQMALVSQEPALFGRTIAENIAYGDNSRQPDMNEIIEVARQSNIHGFVSALPQGYDTPVGDRGTQLSGGQKQRIAIARALIRNPRILLLDEATSALDAESEKVVQEALDAARSGRTCLVIAHRLTTVQNADVILVLQRGKIVEKGTHQELISKKGFYYKLHNTQA